jgi:hypothetical protein
MTQVQIARCISSASMGVFNASGGFTRVGRGAFVHETQRRRCLSRRTTGAGGLIAQFCVMFNQHNLLSKPSWVSNVRPDSQMRTHSAHNFCTTSAFCHHISSTVPALSVVVTTTVFHVVPVASTGPVPEGIFRVDRDILVFAMLRVGDEGAAILQKRLVDAPAGAGEIVEGVEVERGRDGHDDTGVSSQRSHTSRQAPQSRSACNGATGMMEGLGLMEGVSAELKRWFRRLLCLRIAS